jgi:hypothetical protein
MGPIFKRSEASQRITSIIVESVVGKIVEPNLVMHADVMFVAGMPFLVGIFKPLTLMFSTLIKSRATADVKRAIDKRISTVQSEGFKVTEITADGEGAIGAMTQGLEAQGCKVSVHSKSTHSADIDVKIRQIKNGVRSILVLPYLVLYRYEARPRWTSRRHASVREQSRDLRQDVQINKYNIIKGLDASPKELATNLSH